VAEALAAFAWVTAPSSPGENTRTETFVLAAPSCRAVLSACVAAVRSLASAVAVAVAVFVCETVPESPGLPTRTETLVLATPLWVATAPACTSCETSALPAVVPIADPEAVADQIEEEGDQLVEFVRS
jgi:hypothetical protein